MLEVTDLIYILDYCFACYRDTNSQPERSFVTITPFYRRANVRIRKHTEKMFTIVLSQFISLIRYVSFNDIFVCYLGCLQVFRLLQVLGLYIALQRGYFFSSYLLRKKGSRQCI